MNHIDDALAYWRSSANINPLLRSSSNDPQVTARDFGRFRKFSLGPFELTSAQKAAIADGLRRTVHFVECETGAMIDQERKLVWRFEAVYSKDMELVKVVQTNPDDTKVETSPKLSGWPMKLFRP